MEKTYLELHAPELKKVAHNVFSLSFDKSIKKAELKVVVKEAMDMEQECDPCGGGACVPATHKFTPSQYNTDTNSTTILALLELCKANSINTDISSDDNSSPFIPGAGSTTDPTFLIAALTKKLKEGSPLVKEVEELVVPETGDDKVAKKPSPPVVTDPTQTLMQMFLESQRKSEERQEKLVNTITNLVNNRPSPAIPLDLPTAPPTDPTKGQIRMVKPKNPQNAAWAGIPIQPMCQVVGDMSMIDLSKAKRKLLSNEKSTGHSGVAKEVRWPQMCINKSLCPNGIPPHENLTVPQYFCGMANLALIESDPDDPAGMVTINIIKHTSKVASLALSWPWKDCIEFSAVLFRDMEAGQLEWQDWPKIDAVHHHATEWIKSRPQSSNKKPRLDTDKEGTQDNVRPNNGKIAGVEIDWMKKQSLCVKFQNGSCPLEVDHILNKATNISLKHACAVCLYLQKPTDTSHGARNCQFKKQVFSK